MKTRSMVYTTFFTVTLVAMVGMVMGGLFGLVAAKLSPELFIVLFRWKEIEPVGTAIVLGAFGGVLCGGGLGVFGLSLKAISDWRAERSETQK